MRPLAIAGLLALAAPAAADSTSGIDGALFRSSYDTSGVFAVEGARLLPRRDLSLKFLVGYGHAPVAVAVPGIGDAGRDRILDQLVILDIAFALAVVERFELGIDVAAYRTVTGDGYGARGRYASGNQLAPGTGLVALRRISNLDPSASPDDPSSYLGDGLAGPLDARLGGKLALVRAPTVALALVGSVFLPFGEDEMLLGDRSLVFEPKLAAEWRPSASTGTRLVGNLAARIRRRTILESFDGGAGMADTDAKVFLDVGSEAIAGLGAVIEASPRVHLGAEAQLFVPLPASASYGGCRSYLGTRCSALSAADYFQEARRGDLSVLATAGAQLRMSADLTLLATVGTAQLGARGDDLRITTGLVWAPQPLGSAVPGKHDRDGDGIPDSLDACRTEPEDRDGFQDEDGCPEDDNDRDGILDAADRCRDEPEDKDGFEDADGCPERDNDQDGIPDAVDRCPDQKEDLDNFDDEDGCPDLDNDDDGIPDALDRCPLEAETRNGFDDDDGCPDARTAAPAIEERGNQIVIVNGAIGFAGAAPAPASKPLLDQLAALLVSKNLAIRVEVHVPRTAQAARDRALSQQRAQAVVDHLVRQGVPAAQLQAIGQGSARPVGALAPGDPANARVELIKRGTR